MDTAEIKRVIQEQEKERQETLGKEKIIERDVDTESLNRLLMHPNAVIIIGIRRCGKSVLSWLLTKNRKCGYINFDDEALYGLEAKDLNNVLKAFYGLYGDLDCFVFDEIQNISGWELFINRLRRTKKVIITGSNSQLLSGELATHLTGRHADFTLFPFSFKEFCIYRGIDIALKGSEYTTKTAAMMEKAVMEYIETGGLPESYLYGKTALKSLFGDIITKDVVKRHNIKPAPIEGLSKYLVTNSSGEITFNKLKNVFSIKRVETIRNYIRYLENAYLIFILERFSFKLKQQIIAPKKIYCIDTGIINSISFRFTENIGKLFENTVFVELIRRKSKNHDTEIYYWKDHQQNEIDFLIKEGREIKELIQVCYDINDIKTKERELKGLMAGCKEFKLKQGSVITNDLESEEILGGIKIKYIPLWKWLLSLR